MTKPLLIETQLFEPTKVSLTEGKSERGNPIVEGILATAEVKNGNGRYYKRSLWEREMKKYREAINENRACGELDHPDSSVINLKNVSHNIVDAWWDGNHIVGKLEILCDSPDGTRKGTPSGNILKALLDSGIKVGVSSRGMGSLKENNGLLEVQDDFELLCWDFVSTPSNPGSWMNPVGALNESIQFSQYNPYKKVNSIITDILCSQGNCPIF